MLQTHIIGCLVHNTNTTYSFIDINQYAHDVNITISCMLYTLKEEAINNLLTPVLYIQLDNTARENKNKFFIACMYALVAEGYVEEITMSFLMVGHTHEGESIIIFCIVRSLNLNNQDVSDSPKWKPPNRVKTVGIAIIPYGSNVINVD